MRARLNTVAASLLAAFALHCGAAQAAPESGNLAQGVYAGEIGAGNTVLLTLDPAAGAALTGSYHPALGWNQQDTSVTGQTADGRVTLATTQTGPKGKLRRTGRIDARLSENGDSLRGTWTSADGRRKLPVTLARAASWHTQAVEADGGVRVCERPRFSDNRYESVNRELAETCDYFLADGREGPGKLRLEIDSVGQYMVAAVAYASNRGQELPPEVITVDLGGPDNAAGAYPPPATRAIAWRP
ncbi:MAG TPA: hypothetical protein VGN52_09345 [Burkholderiales bacterium]